MRNKDLLERFVELLLKERNGLNIVERQVDLAVAITSLLDLVEIQAKDKQKMHNSIIALEDGIDKANRQLAVSKAEAYKEYKQCQDYGRKIDLTSKY